MVYVCTERDESGKSTRSLSVERVQHRSGERKRERMRERVGRVVCPGSNGTAIRIRECRSGWKPVISVWGSTASPTLGYYSLGISPTNPRRAFPNGETVSLTPSHSFGIRIVISNRASPCGRLPCRSNFVNGLWIPVRFHDLRRADHVLLG